MEKNEAVKKKAYDPTFANEVFKNVDSGEGIKTCMQCGVCAMSCPLKEHMEYSPRRIFALVRMGERDKVLGSRDIMLCTSCYTCKVRCPRKVPVMDAMHGLAHYALVQGYVPRKETAVFGRKFWDCVYKLGKIDEKAVAQNFMLADGMVAGIPKAMENMPMGLAMLFHHRMKLLPEKPIKEIKAFRKMLDLAEELGKGGDK
ncbi:MAG: 4Fe-4S dicluster domain-containing protein [Deltaproteobacteria bacterium]|nr:4Fe-4S dicluster domain-containing protein [Deltaproteobacteria bacterium]MBF0524678.1 4Fe-4S dicluster domain-containing protein [Deltaproteobacteria bacterium]